jgi:hypothetical protein
MPGKSYADELSRGPEFTVLQWQDFQAMFLESHKQGEHVSIVGPTGSGKTVVGLEVCKMVGSRTATNKRPSPVTVLCYKPRDDTMREILSEKEWPEIRKWPPSYGQEHCIVWVRKGGVPRQRAVFIPLLDMIYQEGGQSVYIPEAAHFERKPPDGLGMGGKMTEFWSAARSNKLTVISDTQRPRYVTRSMWTEPAWIVIFPPDDEDDLKSVAALSGRKMDVYRIVGNLGEHEFLCIRRQRGGGGQRALYVSRVDI